MENKEKEKKKFKFTFKSCLSIVLALIGIQLIPMVLLTILNNFVRISRKPLLYGMGCFPMYMGILIILFLVLSLIYILAAKNEPQPEEKITGNESEENVSSEE